MQFRSFICAFFRLFRDLITSCSFLIDILNWVTQLNLFSFLHSTVFFPTILRKYLIVNKTLILTIFEKKKIYAYLLINMFSKFSIKLKASERGLKSFKDCLRR